MADPQETIVTLDVPTGYREGDRLDVYLTGFLPNVSRSKVQRGIKQGRVTVNGEVVTKVSHAVQAGDALVCRLPKPPPMEAQPEAIPIDVVYEDDHLLVVNKAAGMVVHPAYGHRTGTLVNALLYHVGAGALSIDDVDDLDDDLGLSTVNAAPAYAGSPTLRPGLVHRLDKDTSGLLVVAKNDAAHTHLAKQFEARTIHRRYLALVWGVPDPPAGRVETHLGRDPRDRKRMAVAPEDRGKRAITHYETVEPFQHLALLRFRLETGRTHQIRVHAQHLGHPVFGDPTYGGHAIRSGPAHGSRRNFFKNLLAHLPRQALHAHTLGFLHPATDEAMRFEADPPADMQYAIDRVRSVEGGGEAAQSW